MALNQRWHRLFKLIDSTSTKPDGFSRLEKITPQSDIHGSFSVKYNFICLLDGEAQVETHDLAHTEILRNLILSYHCLAAYTPISTLIHI